MIPRAQFLFLWFFGLFFILLTVQKSAGQKNEIATNDLLRQALSQSKEEIQQKYADELQQLDYSLPLIEKIDLRTETDRLQTARQEFLIRTSFNSLKEKKALISKHNSFYLWKQWKVSKERNELLLKKYKDVMQWKCTQKERAFISEKQKILKEKIKLAEEEMAVGNSFDLSEYVDMKSSALLLREKETALGFDEDLIRARFGFADKTIQISNNDWINIAIVQNAIDTSNPDMSKLSGLTEYDLEFDYISASILAEKAKEGKILDFAQARYTVRNDLFLENRFSLGLGFNIPWKGSTKNELNDLSVKQSAIKADNEIQKITLLEKYEQSKISLVQKIIQYQNYSTIINDEELKKLKQKVISSGRVHPIKLLKLKDDELELVSRLNKLEFEILDLYINIMHINGQLYQRPYINFLSASLISFAE